MKKIVVFAVTLVMMVTGLTGCGGNNVKSNDDSSAKAQEVTASNKDESQESNQIEGETRTINTVMGDIEVPLKPQRVIANWYAGEVITLGLNLVGYNAWAQKTMPYYEELTNTTKIDTWDQESVMALEPDLIVTYDEEDYDKFISIAPVLVLPEKNYTPLERLTVIGQATGQEEKASKANENFESKLALAKETFQSDAFTGKTFSIFQDWGRTGDAAGLWYDTESRGGTLVYKYLGLSMPDKIKELVEQTGQGREALSYEVANEYFGDYILWFLQEDSESEYAKTDIFKSIPAVAQGNLVEIPGEYTGLFYYSDVASLTAQLDYMVNAINSLANK